ncbi:hypothetical protein [uncultured Clostridium sp.]|uniref:hypothetical protein n=1 Tax=uncultured Clostridium sp. TaxID=59620 RepID=UPI0026277E97|nr:hypothetical protein [uncultured Clostridium sp.]
MEFPEGFGMVCISASIGALGVYLYYLDKKGKKMRETEKGRKEYYEKYTSNYVKKKHKKMGILPISTKHEKNSRVRMSKKDRQRAKDNEDN